MNRIEYLDKYRFLAVTFALVSHIIEILGLGNAFSEEVRETLKFITRSATPTLLILFGMMGELVYFKKYEKEGSIVFSRLIYRAILCYLIYVMFSTLSFVLGNKGLLSCLGSFFMLTRVPNATIFLLYFFMLLLLMPLLKIRKRYGFFGLFILIITLWTIDYLFLKRNFDTIPSMFGFFCGLTLGLNGKMGPSAFHSISFLILGMCFISLLVASKRAIWAIYLLLFILFTSIGYTATVIFRIGFDVYMANIIDLSEYRFNNDILYFMYGFFASIVIILLSLVINKLVFGRLSNWMNFLGSNTFSYFAIGNFILFVFPHSISISNKIEAIVGILVFLFITGACTYIWENKLYRSDLNQLIVKKIKYASNYIYKMLNFKKKSTIDCDQVVNRT